MYQLIYKIYKFVLILKLRIKVMSENEFANFINQLGYEQKIYAIILRYY